MNIGIITSKTESQMAGIWRVTVDTMMELLKQDRVNHYFKVQGDFYDLQLEGNEEKWLLKGTGLRESVDLLCQVYDIDILYSFNPAINSSMPCKKILTIHDMIPLIFPEWFDRATFNTFDRDIRRSAIEADKIIAMSQSTKRDIIKYYGVDEEKIEVVYSGIQPAVLNAQEDIDVRKKYGIRGPYILSVCTIEPRKNLEGLLSAFCMYKSKYPDSDLQLVLTGKNGWIPETVKDIRNKGKNDNDIILTGYVSSDDLAMLMKKALAMAYVSFYEGFGLPVLEGMAAGKAVITSDTSSMPEVGGDAVIYCNPYDRESIAAAIERVVNDDSYRKELEKKAVERAKEFAYTKTAQQVIKILREVGGC